MLLLVTANSEPEIVNVTSPLKSLALTIPTVVVDSPIEYDPSVRKVGATVSTTLTVLVAVPVFPEASVDE